MGNVNLPTPVALAGGAFCVLGGYLLGVVAGPDSVTRTTAVVQSFDPGTSRLCLEGDGIKDQQGPVRDGVLCGTWRRSEGDDSTPGKGDAFRFVSLSVSGEDGSGHRPGTTVIYGDLVP